MRWLCLLLLAQHARAFTSSALPAMRPRHCGLALTPVSPRVAVTTSLPRRRAAPAAPLPRRRAFVAPLRAAPGSQLAEEILKTDVAAIFNTDVNWNFVLIFVTLSFGAIFEFAVETLEERVPERLLPVVRQSLIEFATLGFIGLVIETLNHGATAAFLKGVSEKFAGEEVKQMGFRIAHVYSAHKDFSPE